MYDDWVVVKHTSQHLPEALGTSDADGYHLWTVSVAGAYDGYGETLMAEGIRKHLLARYLATSIGGIGVAYGCLLSDEIVWGWFQIDGGGADEDVLSGALGEEPDVAFCVFRLKAYKLADGVILLITQQLVDFSFVVDIGNNLLDSRENLAVPIATVQQPNLMALLTE